MSFVKSLLQMSLAGGVMIAAVAVVRALTLKHMPKRTFPVLWYAALARLLLPLSVPCALSVFTLVQRLNEIPAAVEPVAASAPVPVQAAPAAPVYAPPPAAVYEPVQAAAPPAFSISGETVTLLVWLLGAIACAAFFAVVYLRSRREFNQSLPLENDFVRSWLDGHRLRRRISLRQSDRIGAPLTYGVWRPVILMPKCTDWDDGEAVKYVLEHEFAHVRRFDAAGKLVLTAAACLHWFNPLVWCMYVLANRDLELACDEAVLRRLGRETRAEYAMTLIRMAEAEGKNGPAPLCSGFGKSAVEERITAIMKMKKTSLAALLVAAGLVIGVTTVFATSAATADREELDRRANAQAVSGTETVMSVTGEDGKTRYSTDGGLTWMSQEEFDAAFPPTEVVWWTYDEYAAWLEKEKVELQDMLGEKGWTGGRGEFVWTQEEIDRTIAVYEAILADIGRGARVSKTVNGSEDTMLMQNPYDILMGIGESEPTAEDFAEYTRYGLEWREAEKALFYKGERVRYFLDGAYIDDAGGMVTRLEYADAELKGEIDVRAVRQRVDNADGSFDPMGPLTGLEKYSQAEFDARTFTIPERIAEAYTQAVAAEDEENTAALLEKYAPFGLSYEFAPNAVGSLNMSYKGKPVHALSDTAAGVWIANSMNGFYLGPDAVDLEAVYTNGKLTGLKESPAPSAETAEAVTNVIAQGGEAAAPEATTTVISIGGVDPASEPKTTINGKSYTLVVGHDEQGNKLLGYIRDDHFNGGIFTGLPLSKNYNALLYDAAGERIGYFDREPGMKLEEAAATVTALGTDTGGQGTTFAEKFAKYRHFAIFYEEAAGGGRGNVYFSGGRYDSNNDPMNRYLISHFVDVAPDGSVFTFDSAQSGGLTAQTVYGADGDLIKVVVTGSPVTAPAVKEGEVFHEVSGLVYDWGLETGISYIRESDYKPGIGLVPVYDRCGNAVGCFNTTDYRDELDDLRSWKFLNGMMCARAWGHDDDGNEVDGYIREDDQDGPLANLNTPEEIGAYLDAHPEYGTVARFIPLYDDNGKVIGTFQIGPSIMMPSSIKTIDEAKDYLKNYGNDG